MYLIRGQHNLRKEFRGCVATIGNFDGVHLGHQAVFNALKQRAVGLGLPSVVITFEPQPMEYFRPEQAPARLTRLREKLDAIAACGIDRVLLLEFKEKLSAMSADDFIESILLDGLGIQYLYVGDDFRFGQGRAGDFALLKQAAEKYDFGIDNLATIRHRNDRISSTRIRELLEQGNLAAAADCLGKPYHICGRVAHGDERGRTIGFPTMNVDLHRQVSPLRGVYAVRVYGLGETHVGVANIGNRPTVVGDDRYLLEVHLFDFNREVYGQQVQVEFVERIRPEKKFDSFELLRQQILHDVKSAQAILKDQ